MQESVILELRRMHSCFACSGMCHACTAAQLNVLYLCSTAASTSQLLAPAQPVCEDILIARAESCISSILGLRRETSKTDLGQFPFRRILQSDSWSQESGTIVRRASPLGDT